MNTNTTPPYSPLDNLNFIPVPYGSDLFQRMNRFVPVMRPTPPQTTVDEDRPSPIITIEVGKLYSTRQTAVALNCCMKSVRKLIDQKLLDGTLLINGYQITGESILDYRRMDNKIPRSNDKQDRRQDRAVKSTDYRNALTILEKRK